MTVCSKLSCLYVYTLSSVGLPHTDTVSSVLVLPDLTENPFICSCAARPHSTSHVIHAMNCDSSEVSIWPAGYRVVSSISSALDVLEAKQRRTFYGNDQLDRLILILMHKLRGFRTFVLCSTILMRTEHINNDCELTRCKILVYMERVLKTCLVRSDGNSNNIALESLLLRIEGVALRIVDIQGDFYSDFQDKLSADLVNIKYSLEGEIDKSYTTLSDSFLHQPSTSINSVKDIFDSILENLNDFLSFPRPSYVGDVVESVEALKENIIFWRSFLSFAIHLSCKNHEFRSLLAEIEALSISVSHFTSYLLSSTHYNLQAFSFYAIDSTMNLSYDGMKPMILALLMRIKPTNNPYLLETHHRALESIMSSRDIYILPNLELNSFIASLLSTLWEMLQLHTVAAISFKDKLQALYEGLGFLRTLLKEKQSNKFDDDKIRNISRAAIFDAGLLIFSLHQKDFVIGEGLEEFLSHIQVIRREVEGQVMKAEKFTFPKTNVLGFMDFLLDSLTEVRSCMVGSDYLNCVPEIRENLAFLRSFMGKLVELRNHGDDLHRAVWHLSVDVTYKIEDLIDQLILGDILDSFSTSFRSIREDFRFIKAESMKIFHERIQNIRIQNITWTSTDEVPSHGNSTSASDIVVGFEANRSAIIDRLERGSKNLEVVAIVGMPGLGKTTVATKVYTDPLIRYHFHVRAWCYISQVFDQRRVLLDLLNQIHPAGKNSSMNENDLAQKLRQSLLQRRYIIFIDDIWDTHAFDCLKGSFPNNCNGSRILLTSRHSEVASLDKNPIFLPQLTPKQSLELLHRKLFPASKYWPRELHEFGMQVARFCKGLPLTVVIVTGILTSVRQEFWKEVLASLKSGVISALTDECINSIELSYKHLPDYLKPCFLSFGGFLEDEEISVKRLIWLWIAEGFVRRSESKSLEEVATDYLMTLMGRSLVMFATERSRGGVKACRIHDLLHDFCLRKAEEEFFLNVLKKEPLPFDELGNLRRLCVHSKAKHFKKSRLFCPRLRSLSFFYPREQNERLDMSFIFRMFKLLRVLAMDHVGLAYFPREIGYLVQLRYLAVQVACYVSPSIGNLLNLEVLVFYPVDRNIMLPDTFWNLRKLKHLYLSGNRKSIKFPVNNLDTSNNLLELDSLSTLYIDDWDVAEKQLRKFPKIRQLKCRFKTYGKDKVMAFSFLSQLESLCLLSSYARPNDECGFLFPENLRKLTLNGCGLPWRKIEGIAALPNLKVLKLLQGSFVGRKWHMREEGFSKLEFLKLHSLDLVEWTASDDQFPSLEKLILNRCKDLKVFPECLENVATLNLIEVRSCGDYAASFVRKVEECQMELGNTDLKVIMQE